jgi:amino acid adenylation domain-containing protein
MPIDEAHPCDQQRVNHPLTSAQERLWFYHQLDPLSTAYNVAAAFRLSGRFDQAAFESAFVDVVRRHEALRTSIAVTMGKPSQFAWPVDAVSMTCETLEDFPPEQRLTAAMRLAASDAATPFDLSAGPPVRTRLMRIGPDDNIWLLTLHHIICDGWSVNIIWRELASLYTAFSAGGDSPLPPLSLQYGEYAEQEQEMIRAGGFENNLGYWRHKLSGVASLALPTDYTHPPFASSRGARVKHALPDSLVTDVRRLAQARRTTPFMVFLAAFQFLLARYCRQPDIALGLPVAGRTRRELEQLVGLFVNTVVLRTAVSLEGTFLDLLDATRSIVLEALEHQDMPFQQLVTALRPPREPARPPLFQAMIAVEDPPHVPSIPGLRVERLRIEREITQFELTLGLHTVGASTEISLEYCTDLFKQSTITRMARHYQELVEEVVHDPGARLASIALGSNSSRMSLLAAGRGPRPRPATSQCLHELVWSRARRAPETLAVAGGDSTLSYGELAAGAGRLARHLRWLGVTAETRVGLYADRSAEMIVGMLGILTAGGACVPIPAGDPIARIRSVLTSSGIETLVVATGPEDLPDPGKIRVVRIPDDCACPAEVPARWSAPSAGTSAFVLHTSGSTGIPKGVELPHSGLVNLFTYMTASRQIKAGDRVLSFSAVGTDMCLEEIFLALCGGATVVLRDNIVDTAPRFVARCGELGVTVLGLPTAYWHELVAGLQGNGSGLGDLVRVVAIGGDRAMPEDLRRWFGAAGVRVPLVNAYGPTETSINATELMLTEGADGESVPIGLPLPGVHVYVLDHGLQLMPAEVTGELYVGGAGVARGYLGQPGLTADRFFPDPYGAVPGGRMYRTGDLARWRADGTLEFAGRADDQLKIRGFRVEPGEIAMRLCGHDEIADAAVVSAEVSPGIRQLAAYVVPGPGSTPSACELRRFLSDQIPAYMIPDTFVPVTVLPRRGNGKVDKDALPAPPPAITGSRRASSPIEQFLSGLWADILAVPEVGVDDDFFDLGGDSLRAVQLAARISGALGTDVSVKLIVAHPTVAGQASALPGLPSGATAPPAARNVPPPRPQEGDFIRFESRPLLSLIDAGEQPGADAATISCIPDSMLSSRGIDLARYLDDWCQGVPIISGVKDTALGRIAHLIVPFPESRVYADPAGLVRAVIPALKIARRAGATAASLINLLPSATGYGVAIQDAIAGRDDVPVITTGHATTTAAVVLNIERILREAARDITEEALAFIGLGSIGLSVLRLMLRILPHPRHIVLCDFFSRNARLAEVGREIRAVFGAGVELADAAAGTVPDAIYQATLIVAATNVPDVVDVSRLHPGTIMVDDSAPHCFDPDRALDRMRGAADVLCIEGGELHSPEPMTDLRYVPSWAAREAGHDRMRGWFGHNQHTIGGCVLSSLLTARFAEIPATVGPADAGIAERNHDLLRRLGFTASHPELEDKVLTAGTLSGFRSAHGTSRRADG